MKTLLIAIMLLATLQSNGQSGTLIFPQYQGEIKSWKPYIPTNTITRTVIDRFELLSIKYDTKEVRELDSLSKTDPYLKTATSFRVYFEMPGFHFQQRLHSDTLEITNFEALKYIKINNKVYQIKQP